MRSCCCCGVRSGSIASAIYSMVIAGLGIVTYTFVLLNVDHQKENLYEFQSEGKLGHLDVNAYFDAVLAESTFALVFLAAVFFTSIFVFIGISQDNKIMLIPFVLSKCVGFIWYIFAIGLSIYEVAAIGTNMAGYMELVVLLILIPFFIGDVVCALCVLSQIQEYDAGRGRLCDQMQFQRQTVIIHQHMPGAPGGLGYKQMEDAPPIYKSTQGPV